MLALYYTASILKKTANKIHWRP